ncbi:hypothetical protein, partial [Hydrogenophaga sp.]|uniref:hypothetical protein n=1 Tax=Hydrogenophaga sp. TaxID=1904254 RepID=UPI003561CCB5
MKSEARPQTMVRLRLRAALVGLAVALWTVGGTAMAAPAHPDPALVDQARAAELALAQWRTLQRQTRNTLKSAQQLQQTGEKIDGAWQAHQRYDLAARQDIDEARDCLPPLLQHVDATRAAAVQLEQASARSHEAVRTVAQAQASGLASAAQAADQGFQERRAAEQNLERQQQTMSRQGSRCASGVWRANQSTAGVHTTAQAFVQWAGRLAPQRQALEAQWAANTRAALAVPKDPTWPQQSMALPPGAGTHDQRLQRALVDLGWPDNRQTPASALPPLIPYRENPARLLTELTRLQDAATYIDLATASASADCAHTACADFASERRELALRTIESRNQAQEALAQWQQAPAAMQDVLQTLDSRRQTTTQQISAVGAAWAAAVAEATAVGQAIEQAAAQLQTEVDAAHAQAQKEWETAYLLAYGHTAPRQQMAAPILDGRINAPPAMGANAQELGGSIRSHAYELFSAFDGEASDFGAYTYVLLRSASDLETPAVRGRFLQLLGSLQKLPEARLVARDQTAQVNVFCVPVKPGSERAHKASDVAYASDLGQQLKMRAQNGLLTRKEVHHRLTSSPGPFLVTLPVRMALANSATPVLFADLSSYPNDTIADLATHYMNGLVDDFPKQQLLWKPPVLQRVALFMIHLAAGTGQMVSTVMPTAEAAPR